MAVLKQWPWLLNQPGYEYPAELVRAEHHDATSGGNGVGAPGALKVTPQPAPDGTVSILPGGATVKSTYAGADGQSYHARNFQPFTLTVPPTGSSSGGRTDLVILRVCDPQYDVHPGHAGGEISAEDAAGYDFWWFELLTGQTSNAALDYPHVKIAEIVRPANTTIVTNSHIRDVRVLANPKSHRVKLSQNVNERAEVPRTGTGRTLMEFLVEVPEWATHAAIDASIGGAYFRGASGRGRLGIAAFNNSSLNEATPWWEEGGSESGFRRIPYIQAGRKLAIGSQYRGTVAQVLINGVVDTWSDANFVFGADAGARAFLDIDWLQETE